MTTSASGLLPAPPLDPEVAAALAVQLETPSPITEADVPLKRAEDDAAAVLVQQRVAERGLVRTDLTATGHDGAQVPLSLVHRPDRTATSPLVYFVHGGGMMLGNRWSGADVFLDWVERYNAVVATVEYRRAPEHPYPLPQEDVYAGLVHLAEHAEELGVNPAAGVLAGISAGGGLAAAAALMARDRGGPQVAGQLLLAPMLDDRGVSCSTRQYPTGMWNAVENELAWRSLLGPLYGTDAVPAYAAPARAADLSGLPPAFVEVGSAEVFRDEAVELASRIWAHGGQAELHVWSGGVHGFGTFEHTVLAQGALHSARNWLDRVLGVSGRP
ncbi:alpha/beta hydrolase [Quadrisphaera oryzae]|uniref:alpha/beta hydrolase n=1 Tax=Quadrisphaera TaxID=317661 RepID=UPI001648C7C9|nr:alpha/beta hydrolase [Quadrisphaera sp. RL12-1S]MBC3762389.1 alpha/beta hydrolase [Quadrisphaera sp. RL12-1S]